jgi:hypothetical protein
VILKGLGAKTNWFTVNLQSQSNCECDYVAVTQWVTELLPFSRCELLLWEAGSWDWGEFGNPVEGERPLPINGSEDVTMHTRVRVIVNYEVQSRAVSKSPINLTINPKSVYSHIPHTWQY